MGISAGEVEEKLGNFLETRPQDTRPPHRHIPEWRRKPVRQTNNHGPNSIHQTWRTPPVHT
jgi:hypothetical protein